MIFCNRYRNLVEKESDYNRQGDFIVKRNIRNRNIGNRTLERKSVKELMDRGQRRIKGFSLMGIGLFFALFLTACGKGQIETETNMSDKQEVQGERTNEDIGDGGDGVVEIQEEYGSEEYLTGKHYVEIFVKEKGTIYLELDADAAPITVTNFINLAKSGFYDGLTFHRVIDGFMIQGGDPQGDGYGGSEKKIVGEFPNNGVENPLKHTRGAISMARSKIPDSASSQFFIVHQDSPHLDGDYAVFGYVTEGIEIVDDICATATGQDFNGVLPAENQPVIERVVVVEE